MLLVSSLKIGFVTSTFLFYYPDWDLKKVVEWASSHGFEALEIRCRPGSKHLDANKFSEEKASEIKRLMERHNIIISALTEPMNNISGDLKERRKNNEYLKRMIDACEALEVPVVSTWIGYVSPSLRGRFQANIDENMKAFGEVFPSLVDYAEDRGVKIAIENCIGGGAHTPEIWDRMFRIVPSKSLGIEFDPSHLIWQMIDPIEAARRCLDRIYHVHCKDCEIIPSRLNYVGILGKGWFRDRTPGWGDVNWPKLISVLKEGGYDYVLCIEGHHDPLIKPPNDLILARRYLKQFIP